MHLLLALAMVFLPLRETVASIQGINSDNTTVLPTKVMLVDSLLVDKGYVTEDTVVEVTTEPGQESVASSNLHSPKQDAGCHGHNSANKTACAPCCTLNSQGWVQDKLAQQNSYAIYFASLDSHILQLEIRPPKV